MPIRLHQQICVVSYDPISKLREIAFSLERELDAASHALKAADQALAAAMEENIRLRKRLQALERIGGRIGDDAVSADNQAGSVRQ